MSDRNPGGFITKTEVEPSGPYQDSVASGVWTLDEAYSARVLNKWPLAGNVEPAFGSATMYQANSSNTSASMSYRDSSANSQEWYYQHTDGSLYFPAFSSDLADVQGAGGSTIQFVQTNAATDGIVETLNLWGNTGSSGDQYQVYPYRGTDPSTLLISTSYGWYYAYNNNSLWFHVANGSLAMQKNFQWRYSNYYLGNNMSISSKDGSDNEYHVLFKDYASSPASGHNMRFAKVTISATGCSVNSTAYYVGGSNNNGTNWDAWVREPGTDDYYITGNTAELTGSTDQVFFMKYRYGSGIQWQKNYYTSSQNNYGRDVAALDSSANFYSCGGIRKNNAWEPVFYKHDTNGNKQWEVTMSTSGEPRGSVVINDRLYILMTHNPGTGNQLYLFELNTSNGAVVWQNTIKPNTGFTMGYTNNALQEDKDGKLAVQFKLGDSGSAITGNGIVFARGIDVNGGRGGGVVGTALLYQSTTDISMSSYTASSSSSNLSTGSFSVGSINDYSGTNIQNNNVDQTMTNVNNI